MQTALQKYNEEMIFEVLCELQKSKQTTYELVNRGYPEELISLLFRIKSYILKCARYSYE